MDLLQKVEQSLAWKQSPSVSAARLGITVKEYLDTKSKLLNKPSKYKDKFVGKSIQSSIVEDRMTGSDFDLDKGTGTLTGIMADKPLSAEEIITKFKIDITQWRLTQYWNKEKPGGGYFVSANIAKIKDSDLSPIDIQEIMTRVFINNSEEPRVVLSPRKSNQKALFVYTSDKHIGAKVGNQAIYENTYDAATFADRMEELLNEILYMAETFGVFEDVFILDMGDSLDGMDGQTTRKGHFLPQNMNNREAFETYLSVHKYFFDTLFSIPLTNKYHVYGVTEDNHSGDFGYFANRALETYLNTKYPWVETKTFEKFIEHFTYGEHTFCITHGKDSQDMKHGFPLVLNDKTENFLNKYIKYHGITSPNIHIIKGDLHQEASQDTSGFRYRNVLSMFGSSKWMMNNFSATSKGGVSIEVVEKDTARIFPHKITFK